MCFAQLLKDLEQASPRQALKVYVLENGKLSEYGGLLDQLVECNGQAMPSLHSVSAVCLLRTSWSCGVGERVRSGQVQEVECHCRPASPACLPHLAASVGQRVGLLTGMPARSMSRSQQVRSKVEAREIFEAILAISCEVYELKSGQVAVFDGELGERRPFDLKAWHVEFLLHKQKVGVTVTVSTACGMRRSVQPRLPG